MMISPLSLTTRQTINLVMRVAEVIVTNSFVNNLHIYINIYIYMIASLNLILDKSVIES